MTSTSFSWKRKLGDKIASNPALLEESDDEELINHDIDFQDRVKRPKLIPLEDPVIKSQRLKDEGCVLAESERYWEAIKKWNEAICFTPTDEKLYEMKAQALLHLNELLPALQAAQHVVDLNPRWWIAHQTLGRAHLNLGEVDMAVASFSKAVHLNPADEDLWTEDFQWALGLQKQKREAVKEQTQSEVNSGGKVSITELTEDNGQSDMLVTESEETDTADKNDSSNVPVSLTCGKWVKMRVAL